MDDLSATIRDAISRSVAYDSIMSVKYSKRPPERYYLMTDGLPSTVKCREIPSVTLLSNRGYFYANTLNFYNGISHHKDSIATYNGLCYRLSGPYLIVSLRHYTQHPGHCYIGEGPVFSYCLNDSTGRWENVESRIKQTWQTNYVTDELKPIVVGTITDLFNIWGQRYNLIVNHNDADYHIISSDDIDPLRYFSDSDNIAYISSMNLKPDSGKTSDRRSTVHIVFPTLRIEGDRLILTVSLKPGDNYAYEDNTVETCRTVYRLNRQTDKWEFESRTIKANKNN